MLILVSVLTWPFWVLLLAFLCLEVYFVEKEEPWQVTGSLGIFLLLTAVFTDWKPWVSFSLGHIIGYGIAYLALGVIWAYPRWMLFVKDKCKAFESDYTTLKGKWDSIKTGVSVGSGLGSEWSQYKTFEEMLRSKEKMPPLPWDHGVKGKIYMWMAYWPLSAFWILLHRPLEWFWDWVYTSIRKQLEDISYKMFKSHFEGR